MRISNFLISKFGDEVGKIGRKNRRK